MKARKLKSGNWNTMAYSYTDDAGKRHYESFTAPSKAEALRLANQFLENKKRLQNKRNLTVDQAVSEFIRIKRGVLSPSTIKAYASMQRNCLDKIGRIRIGNLTSADMQEFISDIKENHSAKYTKNVYSMLHAAVTMFVDVNFRVTLPQLPRNIYETPTDKDVAALVRLASPKLKKAILLGTQTLRRSEACALKYGDLSHDLNRIYIHAGMVQNEDREWIYKEIPKTYTSSRIIDVPPEVMAALGDGDPDEYVVGLKPSAVTQEFDRLRNKLGLAGVRFHDLRAYAASVMAALNIPTKYIQDKGGWKSDRTLKRVYERTLADKRREYSSKINSYYSNVLGKMQDEMQDDDCAAQ